MKHIVQELENQKQTSKNLFGVLFGQIALLVLMTAVVFAAVMSGVELSKESHVRNGNLVTLNNTAVSVKTLTSSAGLMDVASLPTEAFSKIKTTTIVFDMGSSINRKIVFNPLLHLAPSDCKHRADDDDLKGDVEMTLSISGAYRSVTDPSKIHLMTQQGHVLKVDGTAGTAAITMGHREYVTYAPPCRVQSISCG